MVSIVDCDPTGLGSNPGPDPLLFEGSPTINLWLTDHKEDESVLEGRVRLPHFDGSASVCPMVCLVGHWVVTFFALVFYLHLWLRGKPSLAEGTRFKFGT